MEKKLILTADDFGVCDFIDDGIIKALQAKKINTVSVFVTHDTSESRINNLILLREQLKTNGEYTFNIGLHFSITSGFSILNRNTSLTKGFISGKYSFKDAENYKFKETKPEDIKDELTAQLNLLDNWLNSVKIDHVSSHHGIMYIDQDFYESYIDTIHNFNQSDKYKTGTIPIRSPMSWQKSPLLFLDYDPKISTPLVQEGIKLGYWKKFFNLSKRMMKKRKVQATNLSLKHPDYLADTIYGQATTANISFLLDQYNQNEFSSEFMFHLGDQTAAPDIDIHGINKDYFKTRTEELNALLNIDIDWYLNEYSIKRVFFKQL